MATKPALLTTEKARQLLNQGRAIHKTREGDYAIQGHGRLHRNFVGGLVRRKELVPNWDMTSWVLEWRNPREGYYERHDKASIMKNLDGAGWLAADPAGEIVKDEDGNEQVFATVEAAMKGIAHITAD